MNMQIADAQPKNFLVRRSREILIMAALIPTILGFVNDSRWFLETALVLVLAGEAHLLFFRRRGNFQLIFGVTWLTVVYTVMVIIGLSG